MFFNKIVRMMAAIGLALALASGGWIFGPDGANAGGASMCGYDLSGLARIHATDQLCEDAVINGIVVDTDLEFAKAFMTPDRSQGRLVFPTYRVGNNVYMFATVWMSTTSDRWCDMMAAYHRVTENRWVVEGFEPAAGSWFEGPAAIRTVVAGEYRVHIVVVDVIRSWTTYSEKLW